MSDKEKRRRKRLNDKKKATKRKEERIKMGKRKVNFSLKGDMGLLVPPHGFELNAEEELVFDFIADSDVIAYVPVTASIMGWPRGMEDFWNWCEENNFPSDVGVDEMFSGEVKRGWSVPEDFVKEYYGKKPLWTTKYSQGIVVREKNDDDYYVVVECSRENEGWKYARILATPGGCWGKEDFEWLKNKK